MGMVEKDVEELVSIRYPTERENFFRKISR